MMKARQSVQTAGLFTAETAKKREPETPGRGCFKGSGPVAAETLQPLTNGGTDGYNDLVWTRNIQDTEQPGTDREQTRKEI